MRPLRPGIGDMAWLGICRCAPLRLLRRNLQPGKHRLTRMEPRTQTNDLGVTAGALHKAIATRLPCLSTVQDQPEDSTSSDRCGPLYNIKARWILYPSFSPMTVSPSLLNQQSSRIQYAVSIFCRHGSSREPPVRKLVAANVGVDVYT